MKALQCDRCGYFYLTDGGAVLKLYPNNKKENDKVRLHRVDICPACEYDLNRWFEEGGDKNEA